MKKLLIIFAINCVVVSKCYQFPNATLPQYYIPIVNFREINASIVFLTDNNTDDLVLSALIVRLYADQTVIISRGASYVNARKGLMNRDPNVIILSNVRITMSQITSKHFAVILKSHWSPLYLIITLKNGTLTCDDGEFNKSFLIEIETCLNYIWHTHRVVRVIVSFPYTCPYHYIIYGKKKKSNTDLYDRTIKIIMAKDESELETAVMENSKFQELTEDYPLRANIFDRFPTSIKYCNYIDIYTSVNLTYNDGYCGLDGLVMNNYVNHYRFNLSIPKDQTCNTYGFVHPDTKQMSGSLRCIIDGTIDLSFNSRFMVQYTTKHFFYLHYISTDSLAAVLKKPDEIPLWQYPYNCFSSRTVFILFILITITGVFTWAMAWLKREMDNEEPQPLFIYIINAVTCTMFGFPIKRSQRFRVLRGASLFCSIILLGIYQGNVNYQFTTRTRHKEIKTLNQLYRSENRLYVSPSIKNLLVNNINEQDKEMGVYINHAQLKKESLGINYVLENDHAVTTARSEDVIIQMLVNFTDEAGSPLMYILEEPFHTYYISYICRTGFLFTDESIRFMMRLLETGLPKMYYIWTRRTLKLGDTSTKKGAEPRPTKQTTIRDMRVAFILLAMGSLFSTLIFIVELYKSNSKKKYAIESSGIRN